MNYNYQSLPRSLYIHWPFCPYKCHFCNFVAIAGHDQYMDDYHKVLCKEIDLFFDGYNQELPIDTIFLGGGTPSTYPDDLLLVMFERLKKRITLHDQTEITIEVNPGTLREAHIDVWKKAGINRISIGVQSLNGLLLKKLNRHQTSDDVATALSLVQGHFRSVSVDIIIGLPGVTADEWYSLLAQVVTWPIQHVSMYFLMVHENTPLYFGVKSNKISLPCDDQVVDLYYWSIDFLKQHGFEQYEISNFAKPGYESIHNSAYWLRKPFKAFGIGACSFDGSVRYVNEKNLMNYMNGINNNADITIIKETLTPEQIWLEKVMLGLRQTKGVNVQELLQELDLMQQMQLKKNISELIQANFLLYTDNNLCLTPNALSVENEVIIKLTPNIF